MAADPQSLTREEAPDRLVWSPLRGAPFRAVWLAAVVAICGIWMQDVGGAWLMKTLTGGDPLRVALIQAMAVLPVVLIVLPAGTLGDLVDRRSFLLFALGWFALFAGVLTWSARAEVLSPAGLLVLTAILGVAKAMILPGFAAACAELATRDQLAHAVGLHSMATNAGRIVGPAIAGAVLAATGTVELFGAVFVAALLAFAFVLASPAASFPGRRAAREPFLAAMRAGLQHCLHDPTFRGVSVRIATFFVCAVAVHALLPLLIEDAHWFGAGWAFYGLGAVGAALIFPAFASKLRTPTQLTLGIALHGLLLLALSFAPGDALRTALLAGLGAAWYLVVSAGQLAVQRSLTDALRARGLALFTMLLMTGFLLGAPLWGGIARAVGVERTLLVVATLNLLALLATHRRPLGH